MGDPEGVDQERSRGDELDRRTLQEARYGVSLVELEVASADLLPKDVGALGDRKVWCAERVTGIEQLHRFVRPYLPDDPLDNDARIDDDVSHEEEPSGRG